MNRDHRPTAPLVLEGDVRLYENEGGFSAPDISVENMDADADGLQRSENLDRAIYRWAWGELPRHDRGGCVDDDKITAGRLRITIEYLDPNE